MNLAMLPMAEARLVVHLAGRRVGWLDRNRAGRIAWVPDQRWLDEGQRPRLGLDFLRNPGVQSSASALPVWFENLLPETGSALRQALCRQWGVHEGDDLALLTALGADLPGAVRIDGELQDLPALAAIAREVYPPSDDERWRFSLAGMQVKLSMGQLGGRYSVAGSSGGAKVIVKIPGEGLRDLPAVEHATMQWARAAGHTVPPHEVVPIELIDGLPASWAARAPTAFAIQRFDRRHDGTRVHHEDFCQALGVRPAHKYGNTGPRRVGVHGALQMVADTCGDEEARQFARRIGFVLASGNGDAHLKNWSLEWGNADRPRLSPLYDQVSTVAWPAFGWADGQRVEMGLGIARVRRFEEVDHRVMAELKRLSGLPWAEDEVMSGIERAQLAWPHVESDAPQRMRQALAEHWRRVPVLRRFPWPKSKAQGI